MKMLSLSLPHVLRIAMVLAFLPFTAQTAQAENPFKFLGAKAKQGLSKVKQVVNPRRIGTALKNMQPAPVKPAPREQIRPVNPSGDPDATRIASQAPNFNVTPPPRRLEPSGPYLQTIPAAAGRSESSSIPITKNADALTTRNQASARQSARGDNPQSPDQRQLSESAAGGSPSSASLNPPALAAPPLPATPKTVPAVPAREDLPFGELVPAKTGFVYSPWSKAGLVDVSGIPTGTKVKCPYTSKIFRVP